MDKEYEPGSIIMANQPDEFARFKEEQVQRELMELGEDGVVDPEESREAMIGRYSKAIDAGVAKIIGHFSDKSTKGRYTAIKFLEKIDNNITAGLTEHLDVAHIMSTRIIATASEHESPRVYLRNLLEKINEYVEILEAKEKS